MSDERIEAALRYLAYGLEAMADGSVRVLQDPPAITADGLLEARAALDRLRDARSDTAFMHETHQRPVAGCRMCHQEFGPPPYPTRDARSEDDMSAEERIEMLIRERDHAWSIVESFQRDAQSEDERPCPVCGRPGSCCAEVDRLRAARVPQGEDHEAGVTPEMVDTARAAYRDYKPLTLAKYSEAWEFARMRTALVAALSHCPSPQGEDHEVGRIVKFLADAGETSAAAIVEIEFGRPPGG